MASTQTAHADGQTTRSEASSLQWGEGSRHDVNREPPGQGWVTFAGIMLMIAGVLNVIYGIAAIDEAHIYVAGTNYVFGELASWGWVVTIVGALQVCAALGVWARQSWARWTGVTIAAVNAIVELLYLPAYPWLSLGLFALDLLVIYGLVSYGGKLEEA